MCKVSLKNIKGISSLEFTIPEKKGVYLLTGGNGSGKTTLLIALNRLSDNLAFSKNFKVNSAGFDTFNGAEITYSKQAESVSYRRTGVRWVPSPRSQGSLIKKFPYKHVLYLSTSGLRFYIQEPKELKDLIHNVVSTEITDPLNDILSTTKFSDLKFIKAKSVKGKQRHLNRDNKLYVIKDANGRYYSEQNFSLGERLLLNTLDFIESIKNKSLLLIDEVELALHPIAQIRFYDYLENIAQTKDLTIILSTHSSSLIKHANKRFYLENNSGNISVLDNCYPAYILRDLATEEDMKPDFIFFVEDIMAYRYLHFLYQKYLKETGRLLICQIIRVGGYKQVVEFMQNYSALAYPKKKVQAVLDGDVKDAYKELVKKYRKTAADDKMLDLFRRNKENISFLPITPELGVWDWLNQKGNVWQAALEVKYGTLSFNVSTLIQKVNKEESANKKGNLRDWAKGCLKNLSSNICPKIIDFQEDDFYKCLFESYVEDITADADRLNRLKEFFGKLLNRK